MADSDIFSKLSRILETHDFDDDDPNLNIDAFLSARDSEDSFSGYQNSPNKSRSFEDSSAIDGSFSRPTPFEVWRAKQQHVGKVKQTPKLNPHEWDRLVEKMHQTNRVKHSAMVREQNQGLALELGGHEFKPKMNGRSLELASTMKALSVRMPEMLAKREKFLSQQRHEKIKDEEALCPFQPEIAAKMSDRILKKMGRVEPRTADDFLRYKDEKLRRNHQRKQIVDEVESRELTFKPQIPVRSSQIKERMQQSNVLVKDPITKVTISKPRKAETEALELQYKSAPLTLDSDHPYKHNTNEYFSVAVPNAIGYLVSFSEETATEPIHDYLKFFKDDTHTDFWGCGKYSGGWDNSAANWPGQGSRPALSIPAPKFVVHFRTNGSVNDWGFRMVVEPIMTVAAGSGGNGPGSQSASGVEYQPAITSFGKAYSRGDDEQVHQRLYRTGLEKKIEVINSQAELLQQKVNINLKPWEAPRNPEEGLNAASSWTQSKTHLVKPANAPIIEEMVVDDDEDMPVTVVEYDSSFAFLWRGLRQCEPVPAHQVVPADEEYEERVEIKRSDL